MTYQGEMWKGKMLFAYFAFICLIHPQEMGALSSDAFDAAFGAVQYTAAEIHGDILDYSGQFTALDATLRQIGR